jgi:hypothetical protein
MNVQDQATHLIELATGEQRLGRLERLDREAGGREGRRRA